MTFRTVSDFRRTLAAFACAAVMALGLGVVAGSGTASAAQSSAKKSGVIKGNPTNKRLATEFLHLLENEDKPGLKRFLDPDFILQRDTEYLNKQEYLANPAVVEAFKVRNIIVIRKGTTRVVRFEANTSQLINGVPVEGGWVPRLSTFVKEKKSGAWRLVAHANFSVPAKTS
ncbi:MAG: nuclear transport factor 2 family protein [Solirubrobacterales bacterium]